MNNMKRLVAVMLVLTLALCLVACGQPESTQPSTQPSDTDPATQPSTQPSSTTDPNAGKFSYVIKVEDETGAPVAGITVILCDNNMCLVYKVTGAEGTVEYLQNEQLDQPKAKILVAEGYEIDKTGADEEGYIKFADGANSITLKVTRIAE